MGMAATWTGSLMHMTVVEYDWMKADSTVPTKRAGTPRGIVTVLRLPWVGGKEMELKRRTSLMKRVGRETEELVREKKYFGDLEVNLGRTNVIVK